MVKSQRQSLAVGGIQLNVFSPHLSGPGEATNGVAVLFLLHGRLSKADVLETTAAKLVEKSEARNSISDSMALSLVVVTFDLRNHGARTVNPQGNLQWGHNSEEGNPRHAVDMFSMISGTHRDISFLIDFLPPYLFPHGEQAVERWMVAGISLGGHATWYALQHEPRLSVGIPVIGCPDYLALMRDRANASGLQFGPPILPDSLLEVIERESPVGSLGTGKSPYLGKKILVLVGERVEVGEGVKKVVVYPDVGHEFTASMVEDITNFVWEEGCRVDA